MSVNTKRKPDQTILDLIEEVKNHECLWNVQRKDYCSRGAMARAWMDIAAKLHKKVPDIRAKWKSLKDAYRKEYKKNVMDGEYRGMWMYYDKMDFLRDILEMGDKNKSETLEGFHLDDSHSLPDDDATMSYLSLNENNSSPAIKRRKTEDYENNTMFVNSNGEVMINTKTDAMEEEELYDEQFLVSLLPFFRKLDPIRKLTIRSKIQAAVVEELTQSTRDPIGN